MTALYLYVMNNAVIIMFLKMCYYYYSFYIYIYIYILNNVIYLFNAIHQRLYGHLTSVVLYLSFLYSDILFIYILALLYY